MKSSKLTIFLFLLAALNACEQGSETPQPQPEVIATHINPSQNQEVLDLLSSTFQGTVNGRVMDSYLGNIDLDEALQVDHLVNGVTRYTFNINSDVDVALMVNLIIRVSHEGDVTGYTISYFPDLEWLSEQSVDLDLKDYTGQLVFKTLEDQPFYIVEMANGSGQLHQWVGFSDENGRTNCDSGSSGGGNYSGYSPSDGWSSAGWGEFGEIPDVPEQNEGSQTIIIFLDLPQEESNDGQDWIARTECDPGEAPDHGTENDGTEPIGVLDKTLTLPCNDDPLVSMEISDYNSGKNANRFGCVRKDPVYTCNNIPGDRMHAGIDLNSLIGTNVHSISPGTVISSSSGGGWGNYIIIKSGDLFFLYAHLQFKPNISGAISKGQIIGKSGESQTEGEPHLHIEVRKQHGSESYNEMEKLNIENYLGTKFDEDGNIDDNCE